MDAGRWDALFPADYPFTRHAFLRALEQHGCVSAQAGWQASHLLAESADGCLVGAIPLYQKAHSYGEFVFDFSWARACHQLGRPYYPKLLNAIPFVPSSGPRLGAHSAAVRAALARSLSTLPGAAGLSSLHVLFADLQDSEACRAAGLLERQDLQFQWFNRGYRDFADFVGQFSSDKRKKLLRERRRVEEAGIGFEVRPGHQLTEDEWAQVYALYANTYEERGQPPYLNLGFFLDFGRRPETPFRLILGYHSGQMVCVALTLVGGDTLYGRHWGAATQFHSLHFECCYHQGIELCLRLGLSRYDAGTQGEHKLARGFEPVVTHSFHRLEEPRLAAAVEDFLLQERGLIAQRRAELERHMPYRADAWERREVRA